MDQHNAISAAPASTTSPWFAGAMPCGPQAFPGIVGCPRRCAYARG